MIELDIWAIIWPVLKQVWGRMDLQEQAVTVGVFLLICFLATKILNIFKPEYRRGAFFSEVINILWGTVTLLTPLFILGFWLSKEHPLLSEAFSFVAKEFSLEERMFSWLEIFLFATIFVALQRFLISKISLLLQRVFLNLPFGRVVIAFVLVAEGLLFLASAITLPMTIIVFAKEAEMISVAQAQPNIKPPEVDVSQEVWDAITTGVGRAQANGVACNPYLILAIKKYETGSSLCDASMSESRSCVSSAGCLGMMQFSPETCQRNANRRGVTCDVWDPAQSVEVACYAIADEMSFSLEQSREEFIKEFSSEGFVWNADALGAGVVYDRAKAFEQDALASIPEFVANPPEFSGNHNSEGYIWPAPAGSYVSYAWGASMWYGKTHNGMDIILSGIPPFEVVAVSDGQARYWVGDSCDAGVITLQTNAGDPFHYVHMELDTGKIDIPTDGSWVDVRQGQVLGWILNGTTSCSDGPHLHLMSTDGTYIGAKEFQK